MINAATLVSLTAETRIVVQDGTDAHEDSFVHCPQSFAKEMGASHDQHNMLRLWPPSTAKRQAH